MGIGETIRQARQRAEMTQSALGKLLEVSGKAVAQWEAGTTEPKPSRLPELERLLGLERYSLLQIAYGDDKPTIDRHAVDRASSSPSLYVGLLEPGIVPVADTEYASIGRFDARLSAGPGSLLEPDPEPIGYHLVELQWLRAITNTAPEYLVIVMVDGDSMEPTLSDRDWVLVDTQQTNLWKHAIFAIRFGDDVLVKRVQPMMGQGVIRLHSDNDKYDPDDVTEDQVHLVGRVISIVARKL